MDSKHTFLLRFFNNLPDEDKRAVVNGLKTGTFQNVPDHIVRVFSFHLRAARVMSDLSLTSSVVSDSKRW